LKLKLTIDVWSNRLTEPLVKETELRGGVLCRVRFNEAHRYLSLLGTQRLQGHVERAVETVRSLHPYGFFCDSNSESRKSSGP
jgi:hypothetical protein